MKNFKDIKAELQSALNENEREPSSFEELRQKLGTEKYIEYLEDYLQNSATMSEFVTYGVERFAAENYRRPPK